MAELIPVLTEYARANGGRLLLFGSAAALLVAELPAEVARFRQAIDP